MNLVLSIGDKVRKARESKTPPWSLRHLGEVSGVPWHRISQWELGRTSRPSPDDVKAVAKALGIPSGWFFDPDIEHLPDTAGSIPESAAQVAEGFVMTVAVRSWASVSAGLEQSDDAHFHEIDTPHEVPAAFLVGGYRNLDRHDLVVVAGWSMSPLMNPGDRVLFLQDQTPRPNTVVMASDPEGRMFVKVLRHASAGWFLESVSPTGATFRDLAGWRICGYAVAIIRDPDGSGEPNITWPMGQPIKVR